MFCVEDIGDVEGLLGFCRGFFAIEQPQEMGSLAEVLTDRREIEAEAVSLAPGWRVVGVTELSVPELDAARHLVELAQPTRACQ